MAVLHISEYKLKKERRSQIHPGDRILWCCPIFDEDHISVVDRIVDLEHQEELPFLDISCEKENYWIYLNEGSSIRADLYVKTLTPKAG